MSKFYEKLTGYTRVIYWILVFLISAFLLYLILPGEPKFKYEYQKGFPWRHENLVAPFDFAILKSPKELEEEKTQHRQAVIPYFIYDTTIVQTEINKLKSDFRVNPDSINKEKETAFNTIKEKLKSLYKNGILQRSADTYEILSNKTELRKRTGTAVSRISLVNVYSEKS
ncbi:MAG TPA: hypothetical protein VKA38_16215, partial [Draconibacterium sp.]|nr:hypothetical protein [Draconibacterium sp.]